MRSAWKRLAEALGIGAEQDPVTGQPRAPSAFDVRKVQRPTGMSQRPMAPPAPSPPQQQQQTQQPPPAYVPPKPPPKSPLATAPNSPENMPGPEESAFSRLSHELDRDPDVHDPDALAASIGRRKYGSAGMAAKSAAGKRR